MGVAESMASSGSVSMEEIREKVASRRAEGMTDPTPEQWRRFVNSLSDEDVLQIYSFKPPVAFEILAELSALVEPPITP